jgi:GntR family transcriptional regulator, transcriptional repressor for pyruvate dehydrogenase complex
MAIAVRKVTATEAIVESLKERIQKGEFGPGDRLPSEQFMLQEYGVSRLTLRESLARMAALGIIQVQQGKGAFVKTGISIPALENVLIPMFPQYDLNRMNDLVETRNLLESEMAARVAKSRTEKQIVQLEGLLEYDTKTVTDPTLFARRDHIFHLTVAEMAGNQFLLVIYQALYHPIRTFLQQYAESIKDRDKALERHRPILNAIIHRDVEKARQLAREHAGICASYIKEMIKSKGDNQSQTDLMP